ncbi:MAG: hypothetical protein WBC04_17515 [Candidatus Acidiferrales bacterium]
MSNDYEVVVTIKPEALEITSRGIPSLAMFHLQKRVEAWMDVYENFLEDCAVNSAVNQKAPE